MALLWLLIVGGAIVVLQGLLLGWRPLRGIKYERKLSVKRLYAGQTMEMIEKIENHKRLPVPWLRLEAMLPSSFSFQEQGQLEVSKGEYYQNHKSVFTLKPHTRVKRRHPVTCTRRGIYQVDTAHMSAGDLFGVFSQSTRWDVPVSLTVYPQLLPAGELPAAYRIWQGELEVQRWIVDDPFLITGTRNYQSNDPMNRIHWKASARTGELQVYKRGYSADPQAVMLLNIQDSPSIWNVINERHAEYTISFAATAASELIGRGLKVGFGHNAHRFSMETAARIEPGYGTAHLELLLAEMAGILLKCLMPMEQYLQDEVTLRSDNREERLDYVLISAFTTPKMEQALECLKELGHTVTVIQAAGNSGSGEVIA
ncbi:DUF58 domain-containing protein [Paenibacillus sp. JX-17]|uniref:DUF58 domain-containing protein n=1 Tax=Paenibacillus lacisoli TaxID=3064525 RepID=A0ABT9CDQ9_9BACL|nr:DUF58 domain-containing protein [Paenibacillus sp. JX-17]MDO7907413.1 DUF58 domain-containing protein [Paenibacillus sp. JX-17]